MDERQSVICYCWIIFVMFAFTRELNCFFRRKKSKPFLTIWSSWSTWTLWSSTSTGPTSKRTERGWEIINSCFITSYKKRLVWWRSCWSVCMYCVCRSYSSPSTCPREVSNSFWKRRRKTTRPWTKRCESSDVTHWQILNEVILK